MIRYFGFLAYRIVGELLPKVREALSMEEYVKPDYLRFGQMSMSFLGVNPFECILCNSRMLFDEFILGKSRPEIINEALRRK